MGKRTTTTQPKKPPANPERIQLTEIEMLKGDNINLRMMSVQRELAVLQEEQAEFKAAVEARLKIDNLERYILNRKTGEGRLARKD